MILYGKWWTVVGAAHGRGVHLTTQIYLQTYNFHIIIASMFVSIFPVAGKELAHPTTCSFKLSIYLLIAGNTDNSWRSENTFL